MRLLKYKVNKFRSVKETDWIETDQWTCFVGANEAGKTNLLLPLWKFNPADDATEMDLLLDYPRDEYSQIDENEGERKNEAFIEVLFELTEDEFAEFKGEHEKSLTREASDEGEEGDDDMREEVTPNEESLKKIEWSKFLLIKKDYNGNFYIYCSNEKCKRETGEIEPLIGKSLFDKICERIPKFVYYSEYGNLDSDLYLPRVIKDLKRLDELGEEEHTSEEEERMSGKERMRARTLKILFGHVNLDPEEILDLGEESEPDDDSKQSEEDLRNKESRNKDERLAKIESAATNLSSQFKNWWTQGNYTFHFNADGKYFKIFVSDNERPSKIPLELRSKGLQWFFSFFLVFLAESEGKHQDCILLLDEPGLSLHPNAQKDLIRFFDRLSQENQLIYTTHLPFLVDHNNLDRVKAVYTDQRGLTKASNDITKADREKKAIQPVNAAIGIAVSESLLIGCDIVIVEGVSDQFYLTMIKNHLVSKGKFRPKKEIVFIPVGGASGVKPVVSIIHGNTNNLPISLLDSDDAGKKFQQSLKQSLYESDPDKVIETDAFTGKEGSEIEDLIPVKLIVDSFDRLFRSDDGFDVGGINVKKPIVPQLKQFAENNQIPLESTGWKGELSKRVKQRFDGDVEDDLLEKWVTLFNKIQP